MSTVIHNRVSKAVRIALATSIVASVYQSPVLAEDGSEEVEKIEVTGTRIKRVDIEGPSPVTVITKEEIDRSGNTSVADVLRGSAFNTFGSAREQSGSGNGAGGSAQLDLRGLGSNRTLVLVDGRRIGSSPSFGATVQNLNLIPVAAVERIDVLRDGASAVYGSDAIGGVVNVILKKDFEGAIFSVGANRPTEEGGDENSFSITTGVSSDKGNVTFTFDHHDREQLFNNERDFTSTGISTLGYPGTFEARFPGVVVDPSAPSGYRVVENDPEGGTPLALAVPGWYRDYRCPTGLGASEEFPNSTPFPGAPDYCGFNYAATSAHSSSVKRDSLFVNANYEVADDVSVFAKALVSRNKSFGRYAPAPAIFRGLNGTSANSPMNLDCDGADSGNPYCGAYYDYELPVFVQTGVDENGVPEYEASETDTVNYAELAQSGFYNGLTNGPSYNLRYRNVPGGFRDSYTTDETWSGTVGVQGFTNLFGGADYTLATTFNQVTNIDIGTGYGFTSQLINAVDGGSFDVLAVRGATNEDVAQSFGHTTIFEAEVKTWTVDGGISFDTFKLDGGAAPMSVGFEYEDTDFFQKNDPQSGSGNVFGTSGGDDVSAGRARASVFAELILPVMDEVEVSTALRYDHYNDFGDKVTPKLAAIWRPIDSLLVRASYSEGFRAPSMTQLYGNRSQSYNPARDVYGCSIGVSSCDSVQYENYPRGNRELDAESSESLTLGVVWSASDDLSFELSYYNIQMEDVIGAEPLQDIFDRDAELFATTGSGDPDVIRDAATSEVVRIERQNINFAELETAGIDLVADYRFDGGDTGLWYIHNELSYVDKFERDGVELLGFYSNESTGRPDMKNNMTFGWNYEDFTATLVWNYTAEFEQDPSKVAEGEAPHTLDAWNTFDLQFSYTAPWNGKFTLGATNITNEEPPHTTVDEPYGLDSPFYLSSIHDIYGRVPYVRYEQTF